MRIVFTLFFAVVAFLDTATSWPVQAPSQNSKALIQALFQQSINTASIMQNAPTGAEIVPILLSSRDTRDMLQAAWRGSFLGRDLFQERGGWIYANPNNPRQLQVVPAPTSVSRPFRTNGVANPSINLESAATANARPGWVLVANFHTHPLDFNQEPSAADLRNAFRRGVPGIVISRGRIYIYGPTERENLHPQGNPRAYPEDNDVSNFNPLVRGSVRAVGENPFPRPFQNLADLISILTTLIE